jgi:hypothetical protein
MGDLKSNIKKMAGYIEEETGGALDDEKITHKRRHFRSEGRTEKNESRKAAKSGSKAP